MPNWKLFSSSKTQKEKTKQNPTHTDLWELKQLSRKGNVRDTTAPDVQLHHIADNGNMALVQNRYQQDGMEIQKQVCMAAVILSSTKLSEESPYPREKDVFREWCLDSQISSGKEWSYIHIPTLYQY